MGKQKPNRLKELAAQTGDTPENLVPRTIREEGSVLAAALKLGVAPNTLRYWLKKLGIRAETHSVTTLEQQPQPEAT